MSGPYRTNGRRPFVACIAVLFGAVLLCEAPPDASGEPPNPNVSEPGMTAGDRREERPYVVRLVDSEGGAVSGAWIGVHGGFWKEMSPDWMFASVRERATAKWRGKKSRTDGTCILHTKDFLRENGTLVALHVPRRLVAVKKVCRDELAKAANENRPVEILMRPACRVYGQIESRGLTRRKLAIRNARADVSCDGVPSFHFSSQKQEFEFFLPPGTFGIEAVAVYCHYTTKEITIEPGQRDLAVSIDLPVTQFGKLIDRPAPELRDVVDWKNGRPLLLADLRGKYVLLDFWGYWCLPCLRDMTKLFALHDGLAAHGLVILGVHVDAPDGLVNTAAKLDARLEGIRQDLWRGRDIPFPVALVAPKKTKHERIDEFARCTASADYGVIEYPSYMLIDRDGRVVDTLALGDEDQTMLARLLGVDTELGSPLLSEGENDGDSGP